MQSKNLVFLIFVALLASCQTTKQPDVNTTAALSSGNPAISCENSRLPAAAPMCQVVFAKDLKPNILDNLPQDIGLRAQIESVRRQLEKAGQLDLVAIGSKVMAEFRREYLPFMKIDAIRESIVRSMEAELRVRSLALKNKLRSPNREMSEYDVVIVGTGVHGIVALNAMLAKKPTMRVLIVDASDTGGATFRYANDTFNINSSNRPSAEGSLPLPGRGNINELPGLPIQVSDLSPNKYPSAGDLGSALVTGLYAGVSKYPNVEVLLNTDATAVTRNLGSSLRYGVDLQIDPNGQSKRINTQRVIVSTGLGSPSLTEGVARAVRRYPELVATDNIATRLPRVMTFEDVMRVLSQSNDPKRYFADKKVAVVGTGDSANVFIEFMLGYGNRNGYGQSDGQTPGPSKIFWVGQDKRTCDDFIADIRSRYAQIGTGFRSSDPNTAAVIEAYAPRLSTVEPAPQKRVTLQLERPQRGVSTLDVDVVVLATGFNGGLVNLFKGLVPDKILDPTKTERDNDFLDTYFNFLELKTSTSDGNVTRVGRYATRYDSAGREIKEEPSVFVVGPAAGKLPQPSELVGIIQNTVSIFNNAPRTYATGDFVAGKTTRVATPSVTNSSFIKLDARSGTEPYKVVGLSETRNLGSSTESYVVATAKFVLSRLTPGTAPVKENIKIEFSRRSDGIVVSSNPQLNVRQLVLALGETRDFFNSLNNLLTFNQSASLYIDIPVAGGNYNVNASSIYFGSPSNKRFASYKTIENNAVDLRGIE